MRDPVRIAGIRDRVSEPLGDAELTIGLGEQHHPAIGTDPPAIKGGSDLLAVDDWKAERQKVMIGHGGMACLDPGKGLTSATESYDGSKDYDTSTAPVRRRDEYDGLAPPGGVSGGHVSCNRYCSIATKFFIRSQLNMA
jgi:hypothetical protein